LDKKQIFVKLLKRGDTNMGYRRTSSTLLAIILLVVFAGCAERPNTTIQGDMADSKVVIGNWKRTSGGYRLLISEVEGGIRVEYINPSHGNIRVSQSKMSIKGNKIEIQVVLSGVNYEGNHYDLMYEDNTDTIKGKYTNINGTMYVTFVREKNTSSK
jgi:hypothetical protein